MCIYCRKRRTYPSDVTDQEWAILEPLIPVAKPGGRPQEIEWREIVNGILYVLRSGCPWRMLPHDLPNWSTVYLYFREWKRAGVWEQINAALRREKWPEAERDVFARDIETRAKMDIRATAYFKLRVQWNLINQCKVFPISWSSKCVMPSWYAFLFLSRITAVNGAKISGNACRLDRSPALSSAALVWRAVRYEEGSKRHRRHRPG
jgi:transposase